MKALAPSYPYYLANQPQKPNTDLEVTDKYSGESKGFGFVEMDNNSEADAAIKGLNGTDLKGRTITVNQAKPKSDRPVRGRRF